MQTRRTKTTTITHHESVSKCQKQDEKREIKQDLTSLLHKGEILVEDSPLHTPMCSPSIAVKVPTTITTVSATRSPFSTNRWCLYGIHIGRKNSKNFLSHEKNQKGILSMPHYVLELLGLLLSYLFRSVRAQRRNQIPSRSALRNHHKFSWRRPQTVTLMAHTLTYDDPCHKGYLLVSEKPQEDITYHKSTILKAFSYDPSCSKSHWQQEIVQLVLINNEQ